MSDVIDVEAKIEEVEQVSLQVEPITPATVKTNITDVKKFVASAVKKYQNYVVTEGNFKSAEADYKQLNNVAKALDENRKKIKKEMLVPVEKMESEFKDVIALITPVSSEIKKQLDVFEEERKESKREYINAELLKNMFEGLELKFVSQFVFDDKWLNKTKKDSEILNEAELQVEGLKARQSAYKNDLEAIENLVISKNNDLEIKLDVTRYVKRYEETESFTTVLNEINADVDFNKKQYADLQQKDAPAKEESTEISTGITEALERGAEEIEKLKGQQKSIKKDWEMTFKVKGSFDVMKALGEYMNSINIELEVLERKELD